MITATPTEADVADEPIAWRPGMCATEDCGRLVPDGEDFCAPCAILFGPYCDLIHHTDVVEWIPEDHPSEPIEPVSLVKRPKTKAQTQARRPRKPVPKIELTRKPGPKGGA